MTDSVLQKKIIFRWTMFDWANSAYSLIITSAIFPTYYNIVVPDNISIWGTVINKNVAASYAISFSFLVLVLLSPILSGIADYSGKKKFFMRIFSTIGALACIGMYFFTSHTYMLGIILSIIASIGYSGSLVFYNAFLPEIASRSEQNKISARGYMMGYIGSVLLMVVCLAFILANEKFGWGWGDMPVRLSFVAVGLWWLIFAEYSLSWLHDKPVQHQIKLTFGAYFQKGISTLFSVFNEMLHLPEIRTFLFAFFFYNMGVQTVMYMAVYFASSEIRMESDQLIETILIIQLIGIVGAYLFSKISYRIGNINTLVIIIIIWILICIAAYSTYTPGQFMILAAVVGLVMGGVQSMSRSTYSKLIPQKQEENASYFSFYDVIDKTGTLIGTLTFGIIASILGSFRGSILALMTYFILGLSILLIIKISPRLQSDRK